MSTRALQIELLTDPLIDPTTGSICSGYTAYFYAAGTSTPKNVWTEKEKTNPFTSYLLDSGGKVLLYGDGIYKILIKNPDGTTVLPLDNQKIQASSWNATSQTGTYTATPDDDLVICDGTFTVNLQTVANFERPLIIQNVGAGTITVDPYSTQTIAGSSTVSVLSGDTLRLYPDTAAAIWRKDNIITDLNGVELILDADGDTSITADTDDQIDIRVNGADQLSFKDGVIQPNTNNDIDLGNETGPKRFKDVNIAGTVRVAGIAQGKDITAALHRKIVNINDWDMDATAVVTVAHGLTASKIRAVAAIIVDDAATNYYTVTPRGSISTDVYISYYNATDVVLGRLAGSGFDHTDFNSTSYNRGWITIDYTD